MPVNPGQRQLQCVESRGQPVDDSQHSIEFAALLFSIATIPAGLRSRRADTARRRISATMARRQLGWQLGLLEQHALGATEYKRRESRRRIELDRASGLAHVLASFFVGSKPHGARMLNQIIVALWTIREIAGTERPNSASRPYQQPNAQSNMRGPMANPGNRGGYGAPNYGGRPYQRPNSAARGGYPGGGSRPPLNMRQPIVTPRNGGNSGGSRGGSGGGGYRGGGGGGSHGGGGGGSHKH